MKKIKQVNRRLDAITNILQKLTDRVNDLYKNKEGLVSVEEIEHTTQGKLLLDAIEEYYKYLVNDGVPAHETRVRQVTYINRLFTTIKILTEGIQANGLDLATFAVSDINEEVVGWFFEGLENEDFANVTFNSMRANINTFEIWLLSKGYLKKRFFERIRRKTAVSNPKSITQVEFNSLLNLIKIDGAKYNKGKTTKFDKYYQPWLAKGLQIALEMGGRMDDIMNFKYCNIIAEGRQPVLIKIEDFKFNTQRGLTSIEEKKYKSLPISKNLLAILKESGYDKKKGSDEFVLAGEYKSKEQRTHTVPRMLRKGFSYYYSKLNTGRYLSFKCLRKTNITSKFLKTGGRPDWLSGHVSPTIPIKNYVDADAIAAYYTKNGFSVFENQKAFLKDRNKSPKDKKPTTIMHSKNAIPVRKRIEYKDSNPIVKELDKEPVTEHENIDSTMFDMKNDFFGVIQGDHPFIILKP